MAQSSQKTPARTHTGYHTDFHGLLLEAALTCRVVRIVPTPTVDGGTEFSAEILDPSGVRQIRHIFQTIGKNQVDFLHAITPPKPIPAPTDAEWSDAAERFISAALPDPMKGNQYCDARNELVALIRQARRTAT